MILRRLKFVWMVSLMLTLGNLSIWFHWNSRGSLNLRGIQEIVPKFEFIRNFETVTSNSIDVDWNEYSLEDLDRVGPGEQGESVELANGYERELNEKFFQIFGVSAVVSQKISVNRSIPDYRSNECKEKRYPDILPAVSIILILYKEALSVLLRTLHSLYNRTPSKLVREIVVIQTDSKIYVHTPLKEYFKQNFGDWKFSIFDGHAGNPFLIGAQKSSSEYLVFINSHVEFGYNWLPPLIDPLTMDGYSVVVPHLDSINNMNFQYVEEGLSQGAFNWYLDYKGIPHKLSKDSTKTDPFPNPIMKHEIFAIKKRFLVYLEGAENNSSLIIGNIVKSVKIWLCGGNLITAHCSRVGFLSKVLYSEMDEDFSSKKLFAELWLNEYKQSVYMRNPDKYSKVQLKITSELINFRKSCKPFNYFMHEVAQEQFMKYPPIVSNIASGSLMLFKSDICMTSESLSVRAAISLDSCQNSTLQKFENSWFLDIRQDGEFCLNAANFKMVKCDSENRLQRFRYYKDSRLIKCLSKGTCIEADLQNLEIFLAMCSELEDNQKWGWTFVND